MGDKAEYVRVVCLCIVPLVRVGLLVRSCCFFPAQLFFSSGGILKVEEKEEKSVVERMQNL